MDYADAITCLGDATRRRVFERLRGGPQSVGMLADGMPVSRPAVSQHLRALLDAGLVMSRPEGNRRLYSINPEGVAGLRDWLDQFWDVALSSFKNEVAQASAARKRRSS